MRLEMVDFPVKDVRFGKRTSYDNGVLEIDKEELLKLILKDERVASADLDVAFPGEQTRIVRIGDVVEPRVKVSGPGCVFPGILGAVETVGEGRTHRLSGSTVIAGADYQPTIPAGTGSRKYGLVDMWGAGSQVTPFGSLINIVVILKLVDNVTELEAHTAIQLAELKVAQRLAETTKDKTSENVEVFELPEVDSSLPRIVYAPCLYTEWHLPHSRIALYGLPIRESFPTFVHPNELLDGVLTVDARLGYGAYPRTWNWMNNPVVLGLFREHGKRLNFLGVILQRVRFESQFGKQVTAAVTSQMARLLGVDGAIVTRMSGSGNMLMDVMWTIQEYEKKGVKTVFITPEQGGALDGTGLSLPFFVPEVTAIVSTGTTENVLKLPKPTKVIGCKKGELIKSTPQDTEAFSPWSEVTYEIWAEGTGGIDWLGGMQYTCKEY